MFRVIAALGVTQPSVHHSMAPAVLERRFSNKLLRNDRSAAGIAERESFFLKMRSRLKALYGHYFPHLIKSFTSVLGRAKCLK